MNLNTSNTCDFYSDFVFSGKIKVKKVKETENVLAFYHTKPSWSTHIVIVPKKHIANLLEVENLDTIKEIFEVTREIIKENNFDKSNFRMVTDGGYPRFQTSSFSHGFRKTSLTKSIEILSVNIRMVWYTNSIWKKKF